MKATIFTRHKDTFLAFPWVLIFVVALVYQFYTGYIFNSNETTNLALRIARGASWSMLVILAVFWIPVMRHVVSFLRKSSFISEHIPLDKAKATHRGLGFLFVSFAIVHAIGYVGYMTTLNQPFVDVFMGKDPDIVRSMKTTMYEFVGDDETITKMQSWIDKGATKKTLDIELEKTIADECGKCHSTTSTQTYAVPSMPMTTFDEIEGWTKSGVESRQFRINMTGVLLILSFLTIGAFSFKAVRTKRYDLFHNIHKIGYVAVVLLLLHVQTLQWLVLPVVMLLIELYLTQKTYYTACKSTLSNVGDGIVMLTMDKPKSMVIIGGQYVRILIPALSKTQWHPFSITDITDDFLRIKIRCNGNWTGGLLKLLEGKESVELEVDLRGPYSSPVSHATHKHVKEWILIAGGIGITPFLSLIKHQSRPTRIVWMIRDGELLKIVEPLLDKHPNVQWHIYLTNINSLEGITLEHPNLFLTVGFPNWETLTEEIKPKDGSKPNCFVCGPPGLTKAMEQLGKNKGWSVRSEQF
jgi:predicted ferric reductase